MTPELLTVREVADIFRVHPRTVKRWLDAGRLPYVTTPGGRRMIPASAINTEARREESD